MVFYGLSEGWCSRLQELVSVGFGYLFLSLVSMKVGVEAAGVDVSWVRGYLWLSMVSVKAGEEAAGVDVSGFGLPVFVFGLYDGGCRGCRS